MNHGLRISATDDFQLKKCYLAIHFILSMDMSCHYPIFSLCSSFVLLIIFTQLLTYPSYIHTWSSFRIVLLNMAFHIL